MCTDPESVGKLPYIYSKGFVGPLALQTTPLPKHRELAAAANASLIFIYIFLHYNVDSAQKLNLI